MDTDIVAVTFTKTPIIKMAPVVVTSDTVGSIGSDIRW